MNLYRSIYLKTIVDLINVHRSYFFKEFLKLQLEKMEKESLHLHGS